MILQINTSWPNYPIFSFSLFLEWSCVNMSNFAIESKLTKLYYLFISLSDYERFLQLSPCWHNCHIFSSPWVIMVIISDFANKHILTKLTYLHLHLLEWLWVIFQVNTSWQNCCIFLSPWVIVGMENWRCQSLRKKRENWKRDIKRLGTGPFADLFLSNITICR